jgi:hypothetical protein
MWRARPGEGGEEAGRVLCRQHAGDQKQRPRDAVLEVGHEARDRLAGVGVVAAVEPDLGALRGGVDDAAALQPLQPGRPVDGGKPGSRSA